MSDVVLETKNLTRRFASCVAVDALNLSVNAGEILILTVIDRLGSRTGDSMYTTLKMLNSGPAPREVYSVRSAGVNFIDIYTRNGPYARSRRSGTASPGFNGNKYSLIAQPETVRSTHQIESSGYAGCRSPSGLATSQKEIPKLVCFEDKKC